MYQKMQDEWVRLHNVKVGTFCKVMYAAKTNALGWDNCWTSEMNALIGKEGQVISNTIDKGIKLRFREDNKSDTYNFPFFVLCPISKEYIFRVQQPVLVRSSSHDPWELSYFGYIEESTGLYHCVGGAYMYCLPYNTENKHLLGRV